MPYPEATPNGDRFSDGLTALRRLFEAKQRTVVDRGARVAGFPVGDWAAAQRQAYWCGEISPEQVQQLEAIDGWTWEGRDQRAWLVRLEAARRWLSSRPGSSICDGLVVGKLPIGEWAAAQRKRRTAGLMPDPLARQLESVAGWTWERTEPAAEHWAATLELVTDLASQGRLSSIRSVTVVDGFPLGKWVGRARSEYRSGDFPPKLIASFEGVAGWTWSAAEDGWLAGLDVLRDWVDVHGDASPRQSDVFSNFPIGVWVHNRRRQYANGTLGAVKSRELERLPGWHWNRFEAAWRAGLESLREYVAEHGHTRVPMRYKANDFNLGQWVRQQRRAYRSDTLKQDRVESLEAIPGWLWNP